jgi:hypothetical protein
MEGSTVMPRTDEIVNISIFGVGIDFPNFTLTINGYELDSNGESRKQYNYTAPLNEAQKTELGVILADYADQYKLLAGIETQSPSDNPVFGL